MCVCIHIFIQIYLYIYMYVYMLVPLFGRTGSLFVCPLGAPGVPTFTYIYR